MNDAALGAVLLAVAILFVVGLVIALTTREARRAPGAHPPPGVHLPPPSWLPVLLSIGGAVIGAGLAFDATFPWLLIAGGVIFLVGVAGWFRAANHEWRERELESHDDGAAHH
jgi:hypothetical protein